ncbi:MAG: HD domain-containing protein [Candidatus Aenigmarchaeota archaeon]|nr:HD domain-containing protein [Candidatus Aenigmarchaeota archaeon]
MIRLLYADESIRLFRELVADGKVAGYLGYLKAHHKETGDHSERVGLVSIDLGHENRHSGDELRLLGYGGLLHDIGKYRIPLDILGKQGPLEPAEQRIMKGHPRLGFLELSESGFEPEEVGQIVVAHHEYKKDPSPRAGMDRRQAQPQGQPLHGRQSLRDVERRAPAGNISALAQLVAIADISDALASRRPYKPPWPRERVEQTLHEQFRGDSKYIEQIMERL